MHVLNDPKLFYPLYYTVCSYSIGSKSIANLQKIIKLTTFTNFKRNNYKYKKTAGILVKLNNITSDPLVSDKKTSKNLIEPNKGIMFSMYDLIIRGIKLSNKYDK